jgi:hypothetical protein
MPQKKPTTAIVDSDNSEKSIDDKIQSITLATAFLNKDIYNFNTVVLETY